MAKKKPELPVNYKVEKISDQSEKEQTREEISRIIVGFLFLIAVIVGGSVPKK
jgi:hypothetical protein